MASSTPKINASPALDVPLALGAKGLGAVMQAASHLPPLLAKLSSHPSVEKAKAKASLLWAVLGFALLLHGAQFKGLLLCLHVVNYFFFEKVKASVVSCFSDVSAAREKLKADAPEPTKADPKKKDAKKGAAASAEDAAIAKKALKAVDVEKLSSAAMDLLISAMCCLVVLHGGVAQKVALGHALVLLVSGHVSSIVHFPGHEDLADWTEVFVRLALYVVCVGLSLVSVPLALAMYASLYGASLASGFVLELAEAKGKLPAGSSKAGSKTQLMALGGLAGFGTFWQIWSYVAGSGMAWYFQVLYLPAIVAEAVLGLF